MSTDTSQRIEQNNIEITDAVVAEHGLKPDEYKLIV